MKPENTDADLTISKAELFFKAVGGDAIEAQCLKCKAVEWVIPLDLPVDDSVFLANYFCDDCDSAPDVEAPNP